MQIQKWGEHLVIRTFNGKPIHQPIWSRDNEDLRSLNIYPGRSAADSQALRIHATQHTTRGRGSSIPDKSEPTEKSSPEIPQSPKEELSTPQICDKSCDIYHRMRELQYTLQPKLSRHTNWMGAQNSHLPIPLVIRVSSLPIIEMRNMSRSVICVESLSWSWILALHAKRCRVSNNLEISRYQISGDRARIFAKSIG